MYCSTEGMKTVFSYVRRSRLGVKEATDLDPQHWYYFLGPSSYLLLYVNWMPHLPLLVIRRLGEWRNRTGAMPRAVVSTIPLPTFRPPPTHPSCCYSHPQRGRRGWFNPWCGVSFRPGTTGRIPREAANLPELDLLPAKIYFPPKFASPLKFISRQNLLPAKTWPTCYFSCPSACSYWVTASHSQKNLGERSFLLMTNRRF